MQMTFSDMNDYNNFEEYKVIEIVAINWGWYKNKNDHEYNYFLSFYTFILKRLLFLLRS